MKKQTGIRLFFAILKIFALVALVFLLYSWGKKAYSFGYQVVAQEAVSRPSRQGCGRHAGQRHDRRGTGRASGGQGPGA